MGLTFNLTIKPATMRLLSLFIVSFFIAISQGYAQTDFATAPADTFSTSGARHFWMGRNYRVEWNTPVKVPVINLATEKGGLTAIKKAEESKRNHFLRLFTRVTSSTAGWE